MEGIDLFVKILVFVKILGYGTRKVVRSSNTKSARGKLITLKMVKIIILTKSDFFFKTGTHIFNI